MTRDSKAPVGQVRCLNEAAEGSARAVFRAWDQRLDSGGESLESNQDDPELLLHIPFDGAVKLKAICIIGTGWCPPDESAQNASALHHASLEARRLLQVD